MAPMTPSGIFVFFKTALKVNEPYDPPRILRGPESAAARRGPYYSFTAVRSRSAISGVYEKLAILKAKQKHLSYK